MDVVEWPGVFRMLVFANLLNQHFRTGRIPALKKMIVEDEDFIPIFLLGDLASPIMPYLICESWVQSPPKRQQYFGLSLCIGLCAQPTIRYK